MLPRRLEPEVMDTREEALDYNSMDHSDVNRLFAEAVLPLIASSPQHEKSSEVTLLDLGTGTALIPIEVCRHKKNIKIIATDLAEEMLRIALENLKAAKLEESVYLERADAKRLPFADQSFDGVISNSLIHHIPEPLTVFREMARVIKPGGFLFVRDLLRPHSLEELERLVDLYAAHENPHQRQMFYDSLHAALSLEEVQNCLKDSGLPQDAVKQTSDRHWTISLTLPGAV